MLSLTMIFSFSRRVGHSASVPRVLCLTPVQRSSAPFATLVTPAPAGPGPPAQPTPRVTPSADVCRAWCPSLTPSLVSSRIRDLLLYDILSVSGCGPECLVDPDCQYGYVCSQQRCVERPDPCDPSPCGPGAEASVRGDQCLCSCPPGTVGEPYTACHRGECTQVTHEADMR